MQNIMFSLLTLEIMIQYQNLKLVNYYKILRNRNHQFTNAHYMDCKALLKKDKKHWKI